MKGKLRKAILCLTLAGVLLTCGMIILIFTNTSASTIDSSLDQMSLQGGVDDVLISSENNYQQEESESTQSYRLTDEQVRFNNEMAETNPAVSKIIRPGEAESILPENIIGIENLSTLSPEYLDQCFLYMGDFLATKGYDVRTTKIFVLEGIEKYDVMGNVDAYQGAEIICEVFFFQVTGEEEVYYVCISPPGERFWTVTVRSTSDEKALSVVTDEFMEILVRRGYA